MCINDDARLNNYTFTSTSIIYIVERVRIHILTMSSLGKGAQLISFNNESVA